ncbi:MAG: aldo/keto reductase [Deltaproteobacteria bacterium]|nr:aldo/keto reductase [Deltaproteobacteria bacterium]
MNPVPLGRSGLKLSPLSLGTMTFGTTTPLDEARKIAALALERGAFSWDTADMYGAGASEEVVGELLRGRRDQVVLATKVFAPMGPGPNDRGLSARHILAACDASLRRLGTDYLDLYYLHVPDDTVPLEESLRALEDLVRSGRVRYLAASNYRAWELLDMVRLAQARGWQPISAVQPLYNLVNRDIEVELLPMCAREGLGVIAYSPLARGVLTGKYRWEGSPDADTRLARQDKRFLQAEWRAESVEVAAALVGLARTRGVTAGQLATRWAMVNPLVSSVLIGPRTEEQAREALDAALLPWDGALEAACDALVPPGTHTGRAFFDSQYPVTGRPRSPSAER